MLCHLSSCKFQPSFLLQQTKTLRETISYCSKRLTQRAARGARASAGPLLQNCGHGSCASRENPHACPWAQNWVNVIFICCCQGIWPLVLLRAPIPNTTCTKRMGAQGWAQPAAVVGSEVPSAGGDTGAGSSLSSHTSVCFGN